MSFRRHLTVLRALTDRRGAAMAEYALLVALIAIVAAVAVTSFGTSLRAKFTSITTSL